MYSIPSASAAGIMPAYSSSLSPRLPWLRPRLLSHAVSANEIKAMPTNIFFISQLFYLSLMKMYGTDAISAPA